MKWFAFLLPVVFGGMIASTLPATADEKSPDVAKRYIFKVNKIDPKEKGGVVLKNSVAELTIAGAVSNLMNPGDTLHVKAKGATISTLTFTKTCELKIAKDKTLLATEENVTAKEAKGKTWKSRKVKLEKEEVIAFFPED